ncbi:hypothetical protein [Mucilaginibacter sp.]|uniref:hypothetical protein n=1 Tax=Mucilaginibacter sp. TaxID=1882438 RepID=UPI003264A953
MKKTILFICLVACINVGCKKNKKESESQKNDFKYDVTVNVNGGDFTQIIHSKPLTTNALKTNAADTVLTNAINIFYYQIYDASNKLITTVKQTSDQSNFGVITASLTNGSYTFAIIGSKKLNGYDYDLMANANYYYFSSNNTSVGDTFFKKINVTVSGAAVTQNITLDRIIGQLEINLEGINSFILSGSFLVEGEKRYYSIWDNAAASNAIIALNYNFGNGDYGVKPRYVTNILNTNSPLTVTVEFNGSQTYKKTISVQCKKNTRTVLTGTTSPTGNGTYNIDFNTSYSTDTLRKGF